MQFWGFKRPMGRLWAVLYLSPAPISAADLAVYLKMSSGAVSMALTDLERWGAVTRTWIPGDRKDYFVAEPSVWKLVQRVVRERELGLVKDFGASLEAAESELSQLQAQTTQDLTPAFGYKLGRLRQLRQLSQAGETILSALVAGGAVDPTLLIRTND
jgi:DNA-binding transcriptional regulator GbsR (MarR family)